MVEGNGSSIGGGLLEGMTPWMRWVLVIGPTTVIALFLVWQNTNERTRDFQLIQDQQQQLAASMTAMSASFSAFSSAHSSDTQKQVSLLRQLCVNTSRNDEQRRNCSAQ
jgi:hypothetical protein